MKIHTALAGETVISVAEKYCVSPIKLAENNGIPHGCSLIPGEELLILTPSRSTNAARGESLSDIGGSVSSEAEYSCKRAPYSYCSVSGFFHRLGMPLHRLKVHMNSIRTRRRGLRSGLPGFRKRRKKS